MKYSQFFEVARTNNGFAELQDFFINFDGLKDIILKLELTMKDGDADFNMETEQLRLQFKRVLTEEIMQIDQVAGEFVQKLEHLTEFKNGGKAFDLTSPTTVDFKTIIAGEDTGTDVLYRRALLVKQYCELNLAGVKQIAKEYDNLAGCPAGVSQQEQCLAAVKFLAFADGRIDRVIEQIEVALLAKGEITSEAACRESLMQGNLVTIAEAKDVVTVQTFLQVIGMWLLYGPDGVSTEVVESLETNNTLDVEAPDKMASKGMKASGAPWAANKASQAHRAYGRTALRLNKLWQSMRHTSNCPSMPLLVR